MRRSGSNLSYFRNVASSFILTLLCHFWPGGEQIYNQWANLQFCIIRYLIKFKGLILWKQYKHSKGDSMDYIAQFWVMNLHQ